MNRNELITFSLRESPRRLRLLLATLAFLLLWMGVLFSLGSVIFENLGLPVFLGAAAVPIVALVTVAFRMFYTMPKCPRCGIRLVGSLLHTAIATGNCGNCGRSIDD